MAVFGHTRWTVTGSSAADTEKEHVKAAPDGNYHELLIMGYMCVLRGAATDADILVTLEDADDNVLFTDYFGAAAVVGTRLGVVFKEAAGITVPADTGCKLVTAAGGSSAIITGNIWGLEF